MVRAVPHKGSTSAGAPMMEMNTTPLIDVMLVLLVMLIITIPVQNHAVKLDLPGVARTVPNPLVNKVVITDEGGLLFNGSVVSPAELDRLLATAGQLAPEPELQLQPAPNAPYAAVDEVLVMAKRAQLTRLGFVGNEAYARF